MSYFQFPIIDGIAPSWADIAVRATPGAGTANSGVLVPLAGIKAISTGTSVELGYQKEGGIRVRRTRGEKSDEASITLYSHGYLDLVRGLIPLAPVRGNKSLIGLVPILINVQWTPPGSNEVFEKRLKGCRIIGDSEDSSEGTDASEIVLALDPLEIVRVVDGVELALM